MRAGACPRVLFAGAVAASAFLRGGPNSGVVMAVDKNKFRKCADTGFCRRHRAKDASDQTFRIDPASVSVDGTGLTASLLFGAGGTEPLSFTLALLRSGAARMRVTERPSLSRPPRWEAPDVLLPEGLAAGPAAVAVPVGDASLPPSVRALPAGAAVHLRYGDDGALLASLAFEPLRLDLFVGAGAVEPAVSVNAAQLLHFEQRRKRVARAATAAVAPLPGDGDADEEAGAGSETAAEEDPHGGKEVVDYGEDGLAMYSDGSRETPESHRRRLDAAGALSSSGGDNIGAAGLGLWEESFDGHPDTKPHGPMSVGVDVSFPGSAHLYGIPEHATSMALKRTRAEPRSRSSTAAAAAATAVAGLEGGGGGSGDAAVAGGAAAGAEVGYGEPYRLYTLDVFEYELDVPMALYGVIPLLLSHRAGQTAGAFWFNPSETFVDVYDMPPPAGSSGGGTGGPGGNGGGSVGAHWISESGVVDLMLLPGPAAMDVFAQYAALTGPPELPPLFALGFHQCRWNYKDEKDVLSVDDGFERHDIPYDVVWLDIEHTDGKRYFTWDKVHFPEPARMQAAVAAHGRRTVTIVDPHIKRDKSYYVHSEAEAKKYYITDKDGKDFDGWCWPGSSSYLDFTDPTVRAWWAGLFSLEQYKGSTLDLFTWNDMNEPSVFNGPEVSMRKDCRSVAGVEHREWHNLYGMYMQRATAEGLVKRSPREQQRPFVLSRSFFAGSQRWGAIWTGDNRARWDHLQVAAPMLLSMGLAGLPFVGADVGGFFGDPGEELFLRWLQAGAYQPFFRNHAHHDSRRREPWVFGEPWTSRARAVIAERYTFLPHWYTLFWRAYMSGAPPMRPLWVHYGDDPTTFGVDDQWLVGADLLVKPATEAGVTEVQMLFPGGAETVWYDVRSYAAQRGVVGGRRRAVAAPIEHMPVFQRGGSVVPRKMRLRRSSKTMANDPYTLIVALDDAGMAAGELYADDEETLAFKGGHWMHRHFAFREGRFSATAGDGGGGVNIGGGGGPGGGGYPAGQHCRAAGGGRTEETAGEGGAVARREGDPAGI